MTEKNTGAEAPKTTAAERETEAVLVRRAADEAADLERTNATRAIYAAAVAALGCATVIGFRSPATAVLSVSGIGLFTAVGMFWASVRTLVGDAPLPKDLEQIERQVALRIESPAEARKKTILLQLKDLERERQIGKLSQEDYDELNATYREQAKAAMRDLEAETAEKMGEATALATAHIAQAKAKSAPPKGGTPTAEPLAATKELRCSTCGTENDADARFCKGCATALVTAPAAHKSAPPEAAGKKEPEASAEEARAEGEPGAPETAAVSEGAGSATSKGEGSSDA